MRALSLAVVCGSGALMLLSVHGCDRPERPSGADSHATVQAVAPAPAPATRPSLQAEEGPQVLAFEVAPTADPATRIARGAADLEVAETHFCVTVAGGTPVCWGPNTAGELGPFAAGATSSPPRGVRDVAVGRATTCACGSEGITCWGERSGTERFGSGEVPSVVSSSACTAVGIGRWVLCGWVGGALDCWGAQADRRYGFQSPGTRELVGYGDDHVTWVSRPRRGPVAHGSRVRVAERTACVADTTGPVRCWGRALDYGPYLDYDIVRRPSDVSTVYAAVGIRESQIDARTFDVGECVFPGGSGESVVCVADGPQIECWRDERAAACAQAECRCDASPQRTEGVCGAPTLWTLPGQEVVSVRVDGGRACAVTRTGELWCWTVCGAIEPATRVATGIVAVDLTTPGGCVLGENGVVACWGALSPPSPEGHEPQSTRAPGSEVFHL